MTIEVSAFRWVPEFVQGYVRDLRVRWALEEAGLPYRERLIDREIQASDEYRDWQPFGQVPAYRDGEVELFESGAIVLHVAAQSEVLSPRDAAGAARTRTWVLAAIDSVERYILEYTSLTAFHAGKAWAEERRPEVEATLRKRLAALARWLGDKDYLEGSFTAGDLMMAAALRNLEGDTLLVDFPTLAAYRARCEARPAFSRALEAHMAPFRQPVPAMA